MNTITIELEKEDELLFTDFAKDKSMTLSELARNSVFEIIETGYDILENKKEVEKMEKFEKVLNKILKFKENSTTCTHKEKKIAMSTVTIELTKEDELLFTDFAKNNSMTLSELIIESIFEIIDTEYDIIEYDKAMEEFEKDPVTYTQEEVDRMLGLDPEEIDKLSKLFIKIDKAMEKFEKDPETYTHEEVTKMLGLDKEEIDKLSQLLDSNTKSNIF